MRFLAGPAYSLVRASRSVSRCSSCAPSLLNRWAWLHSYVLAQRQCRSHGAQQEAPHQQQTLAPMRLTLPTYMSVCRALECKPSRCQHIAFDIVFEIGDACRCVIGAALHCPCQVARPTSWPLYLCLRHVPGSWSLGWGGDCACVCDSLVLVRSCLRHTPV